MLNPEQQVAASHVDGPMLVLAGPGTGKTELLAHRVAHILKSTQLSPHNVLCLTFTESAVVSMRKRLLNVIGPEAYYVSIHTFHSFCNEVIQRFPDYFAWMREPEPLSDLEKLQLFEELLEELPSDSVLKPFGDPHLYRYDVEKSIKDLKRENVTPEKFQTLLTEIESFLKDKGELIEAFISRHARTIKDADIQAVTAQLAGTFLEPLVLASQAKRATLFKADLKSAYGELSNQLPKQKDLLSIYISYQKKLLERRRYDFEDMILWVIEMFKTQPQLLSTYQEQFQYILVDEYQDSNGAQNELLDLLSSFYENPNLFVVGDDKQSIYRFQGASLENILNFFEKYKSDLEVVSLRQNYRSTESVIKAAESLIARNDQTLAKVFPNLETTLLSQGSRPEQKLRVAELENPETESYFVAKEIQKKLAEGIPPSEIAVLYRRHQDVERLVDFFIRLNVPFRVEDGEDVLKEKQILKILRLLELISDPQNPELFFEVLHYDFFQFQTLDVLKLTKAASKERKSLLDASLESEIFKAFAEKLLTWSALAKNKTLAEFFDIVLQESGILDTILKSEEKLEDLNRLNSFFDELKRQNASHRDLNLKMFLANLRLLQKNGIKIKARELQSKKEAVRLMTAHKSKGLEFEHVFVIQCVDKIWGNLSDRAKIKLPHNILKFEKDEQSKERNEDERRLFFVALTRAKQSITLSSSKQNQNGRPNIPSLFVQEIDAIFKEQIDTTSLENEALERLQTLFLKPARQQNLDEERDFVRSLLEDYQLSVTHLNHYLECPRLFYYRNLLRIPSAKTKHQAFGTAVHEALRDLTLSQKQPEKFSKNYLLEQFEHHLKQELLSEQDLKASLEVGLSTLDAYYDDHEEKLKRTGFPEYDFSGHHALVDGIPITGKIDKVEFLEDGHSVHVIDYKTGNPDSKSKELGDAGEYKRQVIFYKLLADHSPKFPYEMVSGEIDFIQKSKRDHQFKSKIYTITREDLESLKSTIKSVYEQIQNLDFLDPDEWAACGNCDVCERFSSLYT
mgnify:CR=1 FL=1